jgi:hypothetical protein
MQKAEYIRILVEKSLKFPDDDELDLSPANVASIERLAYVCGSMDKKEMGKTLQFVKNGVVFTTPARKNKFQTILDSQQIRDNLENLDALLPAAGMKRAEIWNHLRIAFAAECYPQLSADQGL